MFRSTSQEEFALCRENLMLKVLQKSTTMEQGCGALWEEIQKEKGYNFSRAQQEAEHLQHITMEELIRFYKVSVISLCLILAYGYTLWYE